MSINSSNSESLHSLSNLSFRGWDVYRNQLELRREQNRLARELAELLAVKLGGSLNYHRSWHTDCSVVFTVIKQEFPHLNQEGYTISIEDILPPIERALSSMLKTPVNISLENLEQVASDTMGRRMHLSVIITKRVDKVEQFYHRNLPRMIRSAIAELAGNYHGQDIPDQILRVSIPVEHTTLSYNQVKAILTHLFPFEFMISDRNICIYSPSADYENGILQISFFAKETIFNDGAVLPVINTELLVSKNLKMLLAQTLREWNISSMSRNGNSPESTFFEPLLGSVAAFSISDHERALDRLREFLLDVILKTSSSISRQPGLHIHHNGDDVTDPIRINSLYVQRHAQLSILGNSALAGSQN